MEENKMMMIINKLKEEFPERCLEPRSLQPINFSQWKVIDIKKFLAIATTMKGISKLKKNNLVMLAIKEWQALCSVSYCGTAADEDLFDVPILPSPKDTELLTTPSCSPRNTEFSNISSVPSSPIPTLRRYPTIRENMTEKDFNLWTVHQLQSFLGDRGINRSGNKAKLVTNAFGTYSMKLPIIQTDAAEESAQVKQDRNLKLVLENGLVTLPDPNRIADNWVFAPALLPDTLYTNVDNYLKQNDAGKAFAGGKSLLQSDHLFNVMVNTISPNIRYCFVKGLCYPEQKFKTKDAYDVWVCLHKDSGIIETGDCSCVAG